MKRTIVFFVCMAYLGVILSKSNEPISPNLKFVATVDGKSYFAEPTLMTWVNAGNYCTSLGMQMASISSQRQADVLNSSYHSTDFSNHHWTSGRDSYLPRQFTWNSTKEAISEVYPTLLIGDSTYRTCLTYYSNAGESRMYSYSCTTSRKVLCETV